MSPELRAGRPRKPRLTDRVLRGIIALSTDYCVSVALDGTSEPEVQPDESDVADARAAVAWAGAMQKYRAAKKQLRAFGQQDEPDSFDDN